MVHALHLDRVTSKPDDITVEFVRSSQLDGNSTLDHWTVHIHADRGLTDNRRNAVSNEFIRLIVVQHSQSAPEAIENFTEAVAKAIRDEMRASSLTVTTEAHLWKRLNAEGAGHPTAFMKGSAEVQVARVLLDQKGANLLSGFRKMTLLKLLPELPLHTAVAASGTQEPNRLCYLQLSADWVYTPDALTAGIDLEVQRHRIRERLISAFNQSDWDCPAEALRLMHTAALHAENAIASLSLRASRHPMLGQNGDTAPESASADPSGYLEISGARP